MFNKLKQFRRIATRYDKTAVSFLGFLALAAAKMWMPNFVNRAYEGSFDVKLRAVTYKCTLAI